MHRLFMVLLIVLVGCSSTTNDLAFTRASDPVWAVNPGQSSGPAQVSSTTVTQGN